MQSEIGIQTGPQSEEHAAADSLESIATPQAPEGTLEDASQAVRHEIAALAQPVGSETPESREKEIIELLSQLDIPAVIRKEGDGGVERIAELLIQLRQKGYGDYLAVYNIFSNLNTRSRREYLELWQERKKQILQSLDEYMPSTEELLAKYCSEEARKEFAKLKKKAPMNFEQLAQSLRKMIAIARSIEIHYVREMNRFRQGQEDNFDCDEHLLLNQALSCAARITVLPEIYTKNHVCQDIPETTMALDWGKVLTKQELIQEYDSDYFATQNAYATANYNQHGRVKSFTYADTPFSFSQPHEGLSAILIRQINMYEESNAKNAAAAVRKVAAKLSPNSRYVRLRRVKRLIEAKKSDEAIAILHQWLEQDPENVDFLDCLARAYLQQKRAADAVSTYETILRRYPNNVDQVSAVYYALIDAGAFAEARSIIERFMPKKLTANERAFAQHQLGYAYSLEGNNVAALQHYEEAVRLDPEEELYRRNIVKLRRNLGK